MRFALDLVYIAVALVTAPWWARKARGGWAERFGKGPELRPPERGRTRVLLHGVSVGEVNLLRPLVDRLTPHADVVVCASTDTGLARACELYADRLHVVRYPLDASFAVRRFLDRVRPDAVALAELELWPNFVRACTQRRIPVCVVNGRLSARSFRGYRRIRPLLKRTFSSLSFAAVQDDAYAERFIALGAPADRTTVAGTMKWDAAADPVDAQRDRIDAQAAALAEALGIDRSRPLIVAGSTGPGEPELLHAATPAGAQLLCAPRKPEWFDDAAAAMPGCVRRSRAGADADQPADRFLLDTIGELRAAYALADLAVVGRSFGDLFGSDPMEPAALGLPILIGPRFEDFTQPVRALRDAGGLRVVERDTLAAELARLLRDDGERRQMADAARACVDRYRGAADRHARMILDLLASPAEGPPRTDAQHTASSAS